MITAKTNRINYMDNLKAILIFLVVFAHLLEPYINTSIVIKYIYLAIYAFHMPLFAFTSGYFSSKNISYKKIGKYFLLFLSIQCVIVIGQIIINGYFNIEWLIIPSWILWYLLSLVFWWLLLKLIKNINWLTIIIAFIIALVVGFVPQISTAFSLSRTITLFPFFLIGIYLKKHPLPYKEIKSVLKYILPFFTALVLIVLYTQVQVISVSYFYFKLPYSADFQIVHRLILFIFAILLSLQMALLVPSKEINLLSMFGQQTLSIYLLHWPIAEILKHFSLNINPYIIILLSFIFAFLICFLFSRNKFSLKHILK